MSYMHIGKDFTPPDAEGKITGQARYSEDFRREVQAAARLVHDGCKTVLKQYFTVEPVRKEEEGARITVDKGFDPNEIRLTMNSTAVQMVNSSTAKCRKLIVA